MATKMLIAGVLAMLISSSLVAQAVSGNQDPPGLDWRQIQTKRFTVIFPEAIITDAQRVANTLEHIYGPVSKTLRGPQKPLEVVLTNQAAKFGGLVALAPRRSVWFSTPPQNTELLNGEWYELLATHEMRHVVQYDRMRRGLVRLVGALSGEMGESVMVHLLTPLWFWEGDAVGIETALSQTGRGRNPLFALDIRALLLAGQRYSYYKAYFRSYRDWYPNHYQLGYFLATYVKRRYGPETWDKVLGSTTWGWHPFAFSLSLKKHTGARAPQIYEQTMDELTELWQAQQKDLPTTPARVLAGQSRSGIWTNYKYPQPLADGSVLVSKSGLADPATLVRLHPDGREERVRFYDSLGGLRAAGGKVAWNRTIPDRRWGNRDYSDVMVLDIDSGRLRQLTHKAKLFAPAPSPDGARVAAIEFGPDRRCHLVVLETGSGTEHARFPAPDGVFWRTPAWSEDGRYITVVRQDGSGNTLERIDTADGQGQIVLPHTHTDIAWPVFWGSYLLFDASYAGINNIHAVHLPSGARYQVTSRPLATTHAAVAGDSLLFEDYTVDGYRIASMPLDPTTWTPVDQVADRRVRYYEPLIDQEQGGSVLENIPQQVYPVHRYRPLGHLLKIHSWYPIISGLPSSPNYSLNLRSSDLLNLSNIGSGVEYNGNERAFSVLGDFSLAAWYPIFSVGGRWGNRGGTYQIEEEDDTDETKEEVTDKWTEKSVHTSVEVPLNFSRGPWQSSAHLGVKAAFTEITDKDDPRQPDSGGVFEENQSGRFAPMTYQLVFDRSRSKAKRDLAPAWGQHLQLTYRHTPFAGDYDGTLLSGRLELRFPGLVAHHSLQLAGGYEWQDPAAADANPYRFESEQAFVRGYNYHYHRHFYQGSANYALPLLYPDLHLGPLVYLQRIKVNCFYDYGFGKDGSQRTTYQTAGAELTANFNPFSLFIALDMGVRYTYRFEDGGSRFGVAFNMPEF